MMESATFTIQHVKPETKRNENEPDYVIWYRAPQKSKYPYPSCRAGALWNKTARESGLEYKGGHIEHPLAPTGKIYIAVYVAKAKEGEELGYSYDVVWSAPKQVEREAYNDYSAQYVPAYSGKPIVEMVDVNGNVEVIPEDEIPF